MSGRARWCKQPWAPLNLYSAHPGSCQRTVVVKGPYPTLHVENASAHSVSGVTTAQAREEAHADLKRQLQAIATSTSNVADYLIPMDKIELEVDDELRAQQNEGMEEGGGIHVCRLVWEMVREVRELLLEMQP